MIDREKVVEGLWRCTHFRVHDCEKCPYADNEKTQTCTSIKPLLQDALMLLKLDEYSWLDLKEILDDLMDKDGTLSSIRKTIKAIEIRNEKYVDYEKLRNVIDWEQKRRRMKDES